MKEVFLGGHMVMERVLIVLALVLAAVPASGQVAFDRKAQLLSVTCNGTPIREVLGEVSRRTGIIIYIDPAVEKTVFIDRSKAPVDEVLNEIIKPLNNMLIYKGSAVEAVRIYQQSPADAMQKIEPGGPRQSALPPSVSETNVAPSAEPKPPVVRKRPGRSPDGREERLKRQEEEGAE